MALVDEKKPAESGGGAKVKAAVSEAVEETKAQMRAGFNKRMQTAKENAGAAGQELARTATGTVVSLAEGVTHGTVPEKHRGKVRAGGFIVGALGKAVTVVRTLSGKHDYANAALNGASDGLMFSSTALQANEVGRTYREKMDKEQGAAPAAAASPAAAPAPVDAAPANPPAPAAAPKAEGYQDYTDPTTAGEVWTTPTTDGRRGNNSRFVRARPMRERPPVDRGRYRDERPREERAPEPELEPLEVE